MSLPAFLFILGLLWIAILVWAIALAKISGKYSEIERAEEDRELIQRLLSQENA